MFLVKNFLVEGADFEKNFFGWGYGLFVTDVISEVVLGSFWLMLPGLGPNHWAKVFR